MQVLKASLMSGGSPKVPSLETSQKAPMKNTINDPSIKRNIPKSPEQRMKKTENVLPEVLPVETEPTNFTLVKLNPTQDTEITLPIQNHTVCVIGDLETDPTVITVGFLTSSQYITKNLSNLEVAKNPLMSETQLLSGEDKKQYISPTIPPVVIKSDACSKIDSDEAEKVLALNETKTFLEALGKDNAQYKPVQYDPNGVTIENLKELITLSDSLNKNQINTSLNENINHANIQHNEELV